MQEGQGRATPFCVAGDVLGNFWGKAHPQKQTKQGQMELKGTTIGFSCLGVRIRTHDIVFGWWEFHSKVNLCLDCHF